MVGADLGEAGSLGVGGLFGLSRLLFGFCAQRVRFGLGLFQKRVGFLLGCGNRVCSFLFCSGALFIQFALERFVGVRLFCSGVVADLLGFALSGLLEFRGALFCGIDRFRSAQVCSLGSGLCFCAGAVERVVAFGVHTST